MTTTPAATDLQPEKQFYALLYKDSGGRLPYDNLAALEKKTPEEISKEGGFPGNGANFAWDRVYWLFSVPSEGGKKVLCLYTGTLSVGGKLQAESFLSAEPVSVPGGKSLDTVYLKENFGGDYPFDEHGNLSLAKFSNDNTVVVAEESNTPLQVPVDANRLQGAEAFFRSRGSSFGEFKNTQGAFRMWDESKKSLLRIDGSQDDATRKAQAIIQGALSNKGTSSAEKKEDAFTPVEKSAEEDFENSAEKHKALAKAYEGLSNTMKKYEKSASELALQFIRSL